jgi:hypothetical protein
MIRVLSELPIWLLQAAIIALAWLWLAASQRPVARVRVRRESDRPCIAQDINCPDPSGPGLRQLARDPPVRPLHRTPFAPDGLS